MPIPPPPLPGVALFVPSLHCGGSERMTVNLARAIAVRGVPVDVVVGCAEGELLEEVPAGETRIVDLGTRRVHRALLPLARYLRRESPFGMISRLNHANLIAWAARRLARSSARLVVTEATHWSRLLRDGSRWRRWRHRRQILPLVRYAYPRTDMVVAVSEGVANDLRRFVTLPAEKLAIIPNPVVDDRIAERTIETPTHPWLTDGSRSPVIVGLGSLREAKDFGSLLRAIALVRVHRPVKLILLGEGPDRGALEALRSELGLNESVDLPGYCPNPYAALARASLFVLSSIREGSPNALTEALACGCPVVATDCPAGPAEILDDGRYGLLVPPRDPQQMAGAIARALDSPRRSPELKRRAALFSSDSAAISYLEQLGYPIDLLEQPERPRGAKAA